jgi:23S rRNA (guanosine2251-2'-O)-methyltransferase
MSSIIFGRNPVMEAIKGGREIEKLIVQKGAEGSIVKIQAMARDKGILIQIVEKSAIDRIIGEVQVGGNHQGVVAYVSEFPYYSVEDILGRAKEKEEDPFIIILDGIEDPHNLGAIMRSAEGAGAHGIIIPKRRAAGLTHTVAKASAGAVEYLPVAKVSNLAQTIEMLKDNGLWIGACHMDGEKYYERNLRGPIAIVIGAEGVGVGKLILKKCDFVLSIPMAGEISSLNASNAAAILMFEISKQRNILAVDFPC